MCLGEYKDKLIRCLPKRVGEYKISGTVFTKTVGVVEQTILISNIGYHIHTYNTFTEKEIINVVKFDIPDNILKLTIEDTIKCLLRRGAVVQGVDGRIYDVNKYNFSEVVLHLAAFECDDFYTRDIEVTWVEGIEVIKGETKILGIVVAGSLIKELE